MGSSAVTEAFVRRMPKVELHVHLEGSIRPATLLALARRNRVELPVDDEAGIRDWFRFRSFAHFVEVYLTCCRCLKEPEDFQSMVFDFMAEQARQNILYSEAHFTIGTHLANGLDGGEIGQALAEALVAGERTYGVRARLIPDIVRDVGWRRADRTLEWALDHRRAGVVALGLSGFEHHLDEPYREHFSVAADEGLHRVAHAGEHLGPETIRSALDVCGAERIGHGIRAVDDPDLVRDLRQQGIPLEVCPTSNVRLGAVEDLPRHPIDELIRSGVPLSLGSDDPPFFQTTLTDEYLELAAAFDYGVEDLAALARAGLDHAFLEPPERFQLESEFRSALEELGEDLLEQPVTPSGPRPLQ